jgi:hypothetical protein
MAKPRYTGPKYSLGKPGKPQYLLGGYAQPKVASAAPAPVVAVPAAGAPAAVAAPGQPQAPLAPDAQYFGDRAQREFQAAQQRAGLDQQQSYDQTDLAEALRRMALKQPQDEQATKEAANSQGLLFSGHLGKQLGDLSVNYERQRSDQQLAFDRRQSAREAARAAIDQGLPIQDAIALAASADRQIARDQQAAGANALAPNDPTAAAAAAGGPAAAAKAPAVPRYTGPKYSLGKPGKPKYRLGGYARGAR